MSDDHRNFDLATNWHDSTALPNPTNTTAFYPPFHGGFPADTAPWEPDQFVQTWSPNAVGTTVGPAEQARGQEARPKSPCVVSVDGVDAVSAAFLQLVEFHERNQLDTSSFDLLRFSLKNGYLAPDDLLAVVDWERLRNLAEKSLGRAFTPLVPSSRIDHSDGGAEPLSRFPWNDVFSVPSTTSSSNSLLPPGPNTLVDPVAHSSEPSAENEQSLPKTPHAGAIIDSPGVSSRRCSNCGVDHTTQWRRHPATSEYLCNRCGHHQRKYGFPRSTQGTRRSRARTRSAKANQKDRARSRHPPEKRGGDILRGA
ncbi:hypothetical protein C8R45DRAFT_368208 [Mycena sanguinolenta]|nr:hypothetical protein C8R45DRAFT_368208 [Mycena sanguinolenta]